ncbi:hypothetical protein HY991_04730, partial [Candidatus Micrarchaeota archaeon]|nr:hypothetical protein [Candidatus Micrarchaeota archaeon]
MNKKLAFFSALFFLLLVKAQYCGTSCGSCSGSSESVFNCSVLYLPEGLCAGPYHYAYSLPLETIACSSKAGECTTCPWPVYSGSSLACNGGSQDCSPLGGSAGCLGDGSDGPLAVSSPDTVVNKYTYLTSSARVGEQVLNVKDASGFSAGDEVLLVQMQNYRGSA